MTDADIQGSMPSADRMVDCFQAFHRTAAVKTGVEIDLFTAIGEGVDTVVGLAQRCAASERGVRILCDYLVAIGLLQRRGDRYGLGADAAAFLDQRSPVFFGSAVTLIAAPTNQEAFARLTGAVRRGGTALDGLGTLAADHPLWVEYARAMAPAGALTSVLLARLLDASAAGPMKVLDIAAGHGFYGIALAKQNPHAEIFALDWAGVLAVAAENAANAGVGDRFRTIPGDVLSVDFGQGYDLVLLTNFLCDLDPHTCDTLLAKVHTALTPSGRAVVLQLIPEGDHAASAAATDLGLLMLATTPGGEAYTSAQLDRMLRRAGFRTTVVHDLPPSPSRVMIAER